MLNPIHVHTAETVSRDAGRTEIEIGIQIVIENRVEIDETAIERRLARFLNGG